MSQPSRRQPTPFPWAVHPIWRGIGCILGVLIPLVALGVALTILPYLLEADLLPATQPETLPYFGEVEYFWPLAAITLVLTPIFFLILSVLGALIYALAGGPRNEEIARMQKRERHNFDSRGRH